jgi:hypothetical protein
MDIRIDSARRPTHVIEKRHPGAQIINVTSRAQEPWVRLSPFYPHGDIPVPLSPGHVSASVEGIWQGLKVFERADVDLSRFEVRTMRGLKRTVRALGPVLGHRAGVGASALLGYGEARERIYLPAYRWVLEHCLEDALRRLREVAALGPVVLLDFETNEDIFNLTKPLSHAALVGAWLMGRWPGAAREVEGGAA